MSIIISYPVDSGNKVLNTAMEAINKRYIELKNKMTSNAALTKLRKDALERIQLYLQTLNNYYANYSSAQIESLLAQYMQSGVNNNLSEYLQQIAQNQSGLQEKNITERQILSSVQQDKFFSAVGKLYSLYEYSRTNKTISIDRESFEKEYYKIAQGFQAAKNGLKETGNALGRVGALSGALVANNISQSLIKSALPSNTKITTHNIGGLKTFIGNQTITADTITVATQETPNGAVIQAYLNFSDKFNAAYTKSATSTVKPVKLATRTINSFLSEVSDIQARNNYEIALMNYLSYHAYEEPFRRVDFIKGDTTNGWKKLRRAIGAEMIHTELMGTGKGYFQFNNQFIEDKIDLYVYGDKIFLADDIIKSLQTKKGFKDFNLAQISLAKRNKILKSANIQSQPTVAVLQGKQEYVQQLLSTSQISYSQTIKFS